MAKDIKANPWVFDATTQGEGFGPNEDAVSVVFTIKPYIDHLEVYTGSGGSDVLIYSRKEASAGSNARYVVAELDSVPADDTITVPIHKYVDGIYIQTLPTGAKVYVYHGQDA